jgi:DNA-binding Lrp family transcriptional regulator
MNSPEKSKKYLLGTDEAQQWMKKYFFSPRGIGFLEPGLDALDSAALSAYNIAKSSYQIRPEVFNMDYLSRTLSIDQGEIIKRMKRMYQDRLIMFVMNPAVQVSGWGLYYWIVKLRDGTSPETKEKLADWFQNKDDICTGYQAKGDFDFFNGNHMRVLDNLLSDVIEPWKHNPEVEYVHLCPVRRDLRESHINMWDAPDDDYRECVFGDGQLEKLAKIQNKMDLTDLKIVAALNAKRPMEQVYDFNVLSEISGLDPKDMLAGIKSIVEGKRTVLPLFYLDYANLGLTNHMFVIRTFQNLPCVRKAEIADELSKIKEFNTVLEFTDSFYDISVWAYNEISDIKALREKLYSYSEIETVLEADSDRQFRRWVCRLDDKDDLWEECVFTDDFLEDRTAKNNNCACRFLSKEEEK